jgi:chemosensory pili system protein ChpA (sensor histidine kinase/response regulator)
MLEKKTMTENAHAPQFDTGPLSWVMGEIRDALGRSRLALAEAAGRQGDAQATSLQHAKSHLHQAHGALQLVDVDGVALMTAAAEETIDRIKSGQLACTDDTVKVVADAYQAVTEYLEELLGGAQPQPPRLFPYYRALQQQLGAERIHPADLLFADLSHPSALPPHKASEAPDYAAFRSQFEKALLPFLKGADAQAQQAAAGPLRDAIARIADAQSQPQSRIFWYVMQTFAALVANGSLVADVYAKQLFGQVNLQIRRLSQNQEPAAGTMLRDALFLIASAKHDDVAQDVRRAFRLDGLVPADYTERRYGKVDAVALKSAKDALSEAKNAWDRLAEERDDNVEMRFDASLETFMRSSERLGVPALTQLLRELGRVARDSIKTGRNQQFGMEMATAMLFLEHALDQIRQLPDDFNAHAETVGARLLALAAGETPPDAPAWQGELSRQIEQGQTVHVLAAEMQTGLRTVEKVLDDYYADAGKRPTLASIDGALHQLQGALSILDQDDAANAARHVRQAVAELTRAEGDPALEARSLENIAQNIGALGFFIDTLQHSPETARERFEFDPAEMMFRSIPFGRNKGGEESLDTIEPAPAEPVTEAPTEAPTPAPTVAMVAAPVVVDADSVEAELLEIFIMEAQEVLETVQATMPDAHAEPSNQETLTKLRRSFHTLKGSGRMVGLNNFADGAHAVEKVMNLWLSEQRAASADLLAMLDRAAADMASWVEELVATGGKSARSSAALVAAAAVVQEGGPFSMAEQEETAVPTAEVIELPVASEPLPELEVVELAAAPADNVIEFPTMQPQVAVADADDNFKRFGGLEIPLPLYNIYLAETDELMRTLSRDFGEWRHEPSRGVTPEAMKAAHTLAGTSATVGFSALREIAHALELVLMALVPPAPQLEQAQRELLDATLDAARDMLARFAVSDLAPEQPELVAQLLAVRDDLDAKEAKAAFDNIDPELAGRLDALFGATMEALLEAPPEIPAPDLRPVVPKVPDAAVEDIDRLFEEEFDEPQPTQAAPEPVIELAAEPEPEPALQPEPEPEPEPALEPEPEPVAAELAPQPEVIDFPVEAPALDLHDEPVLTEVAAPSLLAGSLVDELDPDLLPVFLEEGADLMPKLGESLRAWQQNPADTSHANSLLRSLHTVKGSARMAGAMRLGQHTHDIETQIENMVHAGTTTPAAFDELLANYDHALLLFEQLQAGPAAAPVAALAPAVPSALNAAAERAGEEAPATQSRAPLVRVRADILDRLVNQAGEVSITRSKLENQIGNVRSSLTDFSENINRLRRQLREVEMQAESQIASRMSIAGEREFDPLEFDRFTRLQELTRMMAESVNDVANFQETLSRSVDGATTDLAVQSRLTRDLQQDLMRVRMVPFASLSERLFRVARQAAKELDKRVNLDIRGGNVEIDRSVLEQMAAPFEHLLRNAIVHGIERKDRRIAANKPETGELLVQVSQQGNEVVLQFSDDGGGLHLDRIRAKARANGLLGADQEISDAEAADLIFEPGFSTAESLTELAGRGVGMDVVRSEAQSLGGRVSIQSTPGQGARFTIHLPLTLAVSQVVLTSSAGRTYAVPGILVEQVLQVKEAPLSQAHAAGKLVHNGVELPLHYLPTLLGDLEARPLSQRSSPVLVLRSGAERIALHVDDITGNREVVIKNIGPQLSRLIGIAGATVLGSGDIVLILNPVALAHHLAHHPELMRQITGGSAVTPMTEMRHEATVMVVDDSITVRKVTQRLLEREGFQVVLAKDGVDALERLQEGVPDLMLVDIEMPRMDGFDLTRNIRGNESTANVPIIMITSRTADKHRNYALDLGVNAYFGKPFQEDVLLEAIKGLLQPA